MYATIWVKKYINAIGLFTFKLDLYDKTIKFSPKNINKKKDIKIMVSVVNDTCILCKTCVASCPVDAFHEGPDMVVVNPDVCISCGVCISECPVGAISPDDEAEQKWIDFNAENSASWPNAK